MSKSTDIRPVATKLYFLPVTTRVPLKFGHETVEYITVARARVTVETQAGKRAEGWGETPLSVTWVWPSTLPYEQRHDALKQFCLILAEAWSDFDIRGHAMEVGHAFLEDRLPELLRAFNADRAESEAMPWLAALVCCSVFDIAVHDAFGIAHGMPTYESYNGTYMSRDLNEFLEPAEDAQVSFAGHYPQDYLSARRQIIPAWHLVGGKDPVSADELTGQEPDDGYPVLLADWIRTDGLKCLKIKLVGNDAAWDYQRLCGVGRLAQSLGCNWLSTDFNCTVQDPRYVNQILDRLMIEEPALYGMILYVEQPFPYDLEAHRIDVHSVSARKPLFMDESAHDWRHVRLGRSLGWTGVALKTCKTQTGALLSMCWARAHGMTLMVQDLTNPMLAQVPHVLLGSYAGTIMGVETNSMQFYPEASRHEARVHPGIYRREGGTVDLTTLSGPGFGYRIEEIRRQLPAAAYG